LLDLAQQRWSRSKAAQRAGFNQVARLGRSWIGACQEIEQ
jgi:hypothetical protein